MPGGSRRTGGSLKRLRIITTAVTLLGLRRWHCLSSRGTQHLVCTTCRTSGQGLLRNVLLKAYTMTYPDARRRAEGAAILLTAIHSFQGTAAPQELGSESADQQQQ